MAVTRKNAAAKDEVPSTTTADEVAAKQEQHETDAVSKPTSLFLEDMEKNPIVINNYNAAEVKHTLDDSIRRILVDDYGYSEDHTHTDRKLIMGYGACLFAAGATIYSYFIPYPECKLVLIVSVAAYFLMNGAMLLYALYVEKECVFLGIKRDPLKLEADKKVTVNSHYKRFSSDYSFTLEFDPPLPSSGGKKGTKGKKSVTLSKSVGSWFDVDGEFAANVFHQDIVDLLGPGLKLQ
ncbi:Signal peptidase complex subunit 2 [Blyttiomyces sp. JEL0837]|nr:Signal peptidase complex subunit 2 [Blyttiomyces sp. JEL0837]